DTSIPYSRTWTYTYNSYGQSLTATNPKGHVTKYAYSKGNLSSQTDPLGHVTKYTYDVEGKRVTMTDPNALLPKCGCNTRGRLITATAGTEATSYTYNAVGELIS